MAMAVVEAALRVGDSYHRAREHLARVAHALRERAPKVERERRVAVVGEPLRQSLRLRLAHGISPRAPAPRRSRHGGSAAARLRSCCSPQARTRLCPRSPDAPG